MIKTEVTFGKHCISEHIVFPGIHGISQCRLPYFNFCLTSEEE